MYRSYMLCVCPVHMLSPRHLLIVTVGNWTRGLKRSLFLPVMAVLMVHMAAGRQQLLCDFAACSVWRYFSVCWPCAVKKWERFKKFVKV